MHGQQLIDYIPRNGYRLIKGDGGVNLPKSLFPQIKAALGMKQNPGGGWIVTIDRGPGEGHSFTFPTREAAEKAARGFRRGLHSAEVWITRAPGNSPQKAKQTVANPHYDETGTVFTVWVGYSGGHGEIFTPPKGLHLISGRPWGAYERVVGPMDAGTAAGLVGGSAWSDWKRRSGRKNPAEGVIVAHRPGGMVDIRRPDGVIVRRKASEVR